MSPPQAGYLNTFFDAYIAAHRAGFAAVVTHKRANIAIQKPLQAGAAFIVQHLISSDQAVIADTGQPSTQAPQSMQESASITLLPSCSLMASTGHVS